jgi:hypothetical protein
VGSQAAELGIWGLSRAVFERGLACNTRHPLLLEKLMEVVLHIGDWDAAAHLAARILHQVWHSHLLPLVAVGPVWVTAWVTNHTPMVLVGNKSLCLTETEGSTDLCMSSRVL